MEGRGLLPDIAWFFCAAAIQGTRLWIWLCYRQYRDLDFSLIFGRNFLSSDSVVIALYYYDRVDSYSVFQIIDDYQMSYEACSADTVKPRLFINLFIMLVLLSLVKNLGSIFLHPMFPGS
jgi:hypothetical protein